MSLPVADPSLYLDTGSLASLKREAAANDPKALRAAAQQFEALFTSMVLKSMQKANFKDPLFGSDQQSFYQDMYDEQLALQISKGPGLGLADMLVQQLRRGGLGESAPTSAGSPGAGSASTATAGAGTSAPAGTGDPKSAAVSPKAGAAAAAPSGSGSSSVSSSATASASGSGASCTATSEQQAAFARSLWPEAQQAARQLGVSPVSLIAQAALETDWGRSMPRGTSGASSNNLFGIKAGSGLDGDAVESATREYSNGVPSSVQAQFRSYGSTSQCFQDYVALLQGDPRYAAALGTGGDVRAFASGLQQGGYATDPDYARKLGAVAHTLDRTLKLSAAQPMTAGSGTF
ncbi:MAG TPA: flagellar assembly peptidoglycan hydrolase FlgJ [Steroidobacteraceae bacterium]|nr:flagellar assembly peptidoglycan hydrolase FlgJ [Steroidobacteraceae bacterium]